MFRKLFLPLFLAIAGAAFAQTPVAEVATPVTICTESQACVITAISDTTAVLQFGTGSTWCTTITNPKLPLTVSWASANPALCPFDPAVGVNKTLVAQQKATAYTVTFSLAGVTQPPMTVAGLVAVVATSKTTTYAITCKATATLTNGAAMPANLPLTKPACTAVKQ